MIILRRYIIAQIMIIFNIIQYYNEEINKGELLWETKTMEIMIALKEMNPME